MRNAWSVLSLAALVASPGCGQQPPVLVSRIGTQQVSPAPAGSPAVDEAYFDEQGRLRWDGSSLAPPEACPPGLKESQRITRMVDPRVDEVRCSLEASNPAPPRAFLVGIDPERKVAWRRPLGFQSGEFLFDERVVGTGPGGIVLSDLALVSPRTGETLAPPPTHPAGDERRPVPDKEVAYTAIALPDPGSFLVFDADVTLVRKRGGLYRVKPGASRDELVLGVSTTWLGGQWRVEDMALSQDGRFVFLAQRLDVRGPGGVSFAVFDLRAKRLLFEERHGPNHSCREPEVVTGPRSRVGFSYLDQNEGRRVLVEYRIDLRSP